MSQPQPPRPRLQSQTTENVLDSRRTWLILGVLAAILVVGGVLFGVAFGDEVDDEPIGTPAMTVVAPAEAQVARSAVLVARL